MKLYTYKELKNEIIMTKVRIAKTNSPYLKRDLNKKLRTLQAELQEYEGYTK